MLLGIVESEPVLQVRPRCGELAQPQQGVSQYVVAPQEEGRIALTLGQDQELFPKITGTLQLTALFI